MKRKIAAFILACIGTICLCVCLSACIPQTPDYKKIELGDGKETVKEILGEPDADNDREWEYYEGTFKKKYSRVTELSGLISKAESAQEAEDLLREWEALNEELATLEHTLLRIDFTDGKVSAVTYDNKATSLTEAGEKQQKHAECYPESIPAMSDISKIEFTAKVDYTDGSYSYGSVTPYSLDTFYSGYRGVSFATVFCAECESAITVENDIVAGTTYSGTCGSASFTVTAPDGGDINTARIVATFDPIEKLNYYETENDFGSTDWANYYRIVTEIVLPEGLKEIGWGSFIYCHSLKTVTIPEGVIKVGRSAFMGCDKLSSINLPESLTTIEDDAFEGCFALKELNIPKSVTSIGKNAFGECHFNSLTVAEENLSYKNVGNCVLTKDGQTLLFANDNIVPKGVTYIDEYAFYGNGLEFIYIPQGVTSIGQQAFCGCKNLKTVILPSTLISIGANAFNRCPSLKNLNIPASVSYLGIGAFSQCDFDNLTVSVNSPYFKSVNNLILSKDGTTLIVSDANCTVPSGITGIGEGAFAGNQNVERIVLPEGISSIGIYAFDFCDNLKTVVLPSTLQVIDDYAFFDCRSLEEVTIPANLQSIGYEAFDYCESLSVINFTGTKEQWSALTQNTDLGRGMGEYTVHCSDGDIVK